MSRIRLYVDEDASDHRVIEGVANSGIDVLTAQQAGMRRRSDEEQLEFATSHGRAIYSQNARDFARLHVDWFAQKRSHAGIIVVPRQRYSVGEKVRRLSALLSSMTAEEFVNRLEYL